MSAPEAGMRDKPLFFLMTYHIYWALRNRSSMIAAYVTFKSVMTLAFRRKELLVLLALCAQGSERMHREFWLGFWSFLILTIWHRCLLFDTHNNFSLVYTGSICL